MTQIFDFRYRGLHAKTRDGLGIGMFVLQKALNLNGLKMEAMPDYSKMEQAGKEQYILNEFSVAHI